MFCGKIFCDGGNDYPITGQKAVIRTLRGFCNIAGDQSEEDALSMVPTGTKCGHNKVSIEECYLDYDGSTCRLKNENSGLCFNRFAMIICAKT